LPDSDEFDDFYRGTAPRLLRYAYGLTTDTAEAQDLVQEAFSRAWQRWRRLRRYEDPEGWLRLVVTRLATDWWRRTKVRRDAAAAQRPPAPADPPDETVLLIVDAMRTLPAAQRRALTLHYLLDRSIAQIAAETGASEGTVKSWLSRGRSALAGHLGAKDSTPTTSDGGRDAP
jgi:RNA polymerase sigma-70 factor (ECF subfamily)